MHRGSIHLYTACESFAHAVEQTTTTTSTRTFPTLLPPKPGTEVSEDIRTVFSRWRGGGGFTDSLGQDMFDPKWQN